MKKIKIIIAALISFLLIFCMKNVCFAESYMNKEERQQMLDAYNAFVEADKGAETVGESLTLAWSTLINSEYLYCASYHQWLNNPVEYKVVKYIEIQGDSAKEPKTNKETQCHWNAILGKILSGSYGIEYGEKGENEEVQILLWNFFSDWLKWERWNRTPGQQGNFTVEDYFELDGWGSEEYAGDDAEYYQGRISDLWNAVELEWEEKKSLKEFNPTKVKLYFLETTAPIENNPNYNNNGNWEPKPYQKLIIAIPEEMPETKLVIKKVDGDTDKNLPNVSFTIRNNSTGKYISSISSATDEGNNIFTVTGYSASEEDAIPFTTGTSKYQDIVLKGLAQGIYRIKEIENRNNGYGANDGETWSAQVIEFQSVTVKLKNYKEEEKEEDDDFDEGKGNVTISGMVWEDLFDGKSNKIDNIFEKDSNKSDAYKDGEQGLEGVYVYLRNKNGKELASTKTDKDGYYELKYKIEIDDHVYGIQKGEDTTYYEIDHAYIEFKYNGVMYTTVANVDTPTENKSIAKESYKSRQEINDNFQEVTYRNVKNAEGENTYRVSYTRSPNVSKVNQDVNDFPVTASTKWTISNFMTIAEASKSGTKWCHAHCSNGQHKMGYHHSDCYWKDITDKDGKVIGQERVHVGNCDPYYCDEVSHCYPNPTENTHEAIDTWTITNINLGLVRREQPDLAITSDIEQVIVVMNNQEYTYNYEHREIKSVKLYQAETTVDSDGKEVEGKFSTSEKNNYLKERYHRDINPADLAYVDYHDTEDLQVYVTYNIYVKNQSGTTPVKVEEIVHYHDERLEYNSRNKYCRNNSSDGWGYTSKYGDGYVDNGYVALYSHKAFDDQDSVDPNEISDPAQITYRVKDEVVKSLLNNDVQILRSVSEIYSYCSFYGSNTRTAEDTIAKNYKVPEGKNSKMTGDCYAGIDTDSAPGNVEMSEVVQGIYDSCEDDTDISPTITFGKYSYKTLSGTVYEDTDDVTNDNERLGNGKIDSKENGVEGVKVQLFKTDGRGALYPAYLYSIDRGGQGERKLAVTYTNSNGNYKFGDEDGLGVPVDEYIIKYTYGNDETEVISDEDTEIVELNTKIKGNTINARNYKSTIITDSTVKNAVKNSDEYWHLTTNDSYSVAVDDIDERLNIPSLRYDNFNDPHNMSAYTPTFEIQIEYTEDQFAYVAANGSGIDVVFVENSPVFDFGIIERPRENIVVETTISNLSIVLADGQVLTEGNPYTDRMQYVKAIGDKEIRTRGKALNAPEKLVSLEIDQEIIQGARIDIEYSITVTNNSEYDYEFDPANGGNNGYYYFGDKTSGMINTCIEKLVQYVDTDLILDENAAVNQVWTKVKANDLYGDTDLNGEIDTIQYISENTYNTVKDNYVLYTTDHFRNIIPGQSHTEKLFVSRLLANQAEDYTFENHAEILETNNKIARNIKEVYFNTLTNKSTGEQVIKEYKPGTYMPALSRVWTDSYDGRAYVTNGHAEEVGLHLQDDDMIKLTITPPTGASENIIIYIITTAIGLIATGGIAIFIKKKMK